MYGFTLMRMNCTGEYCMHSFTLSENELHWRVLYAWFYTLSENELHWRVLWAWFYTHENELHWRVLHA